jgi:hypothetical protein
LDLFLILDALISVEGLKGAMSRFVQKIEGLKDMSLSTSNLPNSFDRVGANHPLWSSTRRICSATHNAQKVTMNTAKDLTKEPPRSLCERIGGYAVLARMADKGRATLSGTAGEYHFNCPLDNMLFSFKGVQAEDVKNLLASGATDEQIAAWFNENGIPKTADEIKAWSDSVEAIRPYENPEQRDWFASECARLGLDPVKSRLCDYLDTDDSRLAS